MRVVQSAEMCRAINGTTRVEFPIVIQFCVGSCWFFLLFQRFCFHGARISHFGPAGSRSDRHLRRNGGGVSVSYPNTQKPEPFRINDRRRKRVDTITRNNWADERFHFYACRRCVRRHIAFVKTCHRELMTEKREKVRLRFIGGTARRRRNAHTSTVGD
jgi:hypothetical protein